MVRCKSKKKFNEVEYLKDLDATFILSHDIVIMTRNVVLCHSENQLILAFFPLFYPSCICNFRMRLP